MSHIRHPAFHSIRCFQGDAEHLQVLLYKMGSAAIWGNKGEGETNLLTSCGRDAIMSSSDGPVRVEQKGIGNY